MNNDNAQIVQAKRKTEPIFNESTTNNNKKINIKENAKIVHK